MEKEKKAFLRGAKDGIPIALGYLAVSFGFGLMAMQMGIDPLSVVLISMTNLTSAGQVAGVGIIAAMGSLAEMALTQLVINLRYALMSISLSQKLEPGFRLLERLLVSFGITDEIFAVASSRPEKISAKYMYGLILVPFLGWTGGTILGVVCGAVLPDIVKNALGIAIYGMFLAIIIPPSRTSRGILLAVVSAIVIRCILTYVPLFSSVSDGFAIILCGVLASGLAAIFYPVQDMSEDGREEAK